MLLVFTQVYTLCYLYHRGAQLIIAILTNNSYSVRMSAIMHTLSHSVHSTIILSDPNANYPIRYDVPAP